MQPAVVTVDVRIGHTGGGGWPVHPHPRSLMRGTPYDLSSIDDDRIRVASGAQFMDEGIELSRASEATAHVLIMTPLGDGTPVPR